MWRPGVVYSTSRFMRCGRGGAMKVSSANQHILERSKSVPLTATRSWNGFGKPPLSLWVVPTLIVPAVYFGVAALLHGLDVPKWLGLEIEIGVLSFLMLSISGWVLGQRAWKRARIKKVNAASHILYLRPFIVDANTRLNPYVTDSFQGTAAPFEECLAVLCEELGPVGVRAIGERRQDFIGPTSVVTTDMKWRGEVAREIEDAALIVGIPGPSAGSMWELETIAHGSARQKAIWVLLPASSGGARHGIFDLWRRKPRFERMWQAVQKRTPHLPIPDYHSEGLIFAFVTSDAGEIQVVKEYFSLERLKQIVAFSVGIYDPPHIPEGEWSGTTRGSFYIG